MPKNVDSDSVSAPVAKAPLRFMNVKEAAEMLRLAPRMLDKYRIFGKGPQYYKFGSRVVYDMSDVQAWAEKRAASATSVRTAKGERNQC